MNGKLMVRLDGNFYQFAYYNDKKIHLDDTSIAFMLEMYTPEYREILGNHGGVYYPEYNITYFKKKEDIAMAKEELESVLLIKKMIK